MGSYASPEAAYWAFFTTFNDRSASGRAGVMSYPHVRVSAATLAPRITDTAEEFEAAASWDAVDRTGWAWTQPITPRVMHRSPDKVHFAGGWTRLRADGSVISRNRLLYIASEMEDGWGIQGAFGVEGYVAGADAEEPTQAAMALIDRMMTTLAAGEVDAVLTCCFGDVPFAGVGDDLVVGSTQPPAVLAGVVEVDDETHGGSLPSGGEWSGVRSLSAHCRLVPDSTLDSSLRDKWGINGS